MKSQGVSTGLRRHKRSADRRSGPRPVGAVPTAAEVIDLPKNPWCVCLPRTTRWFPGGFLEGLWISLPLEVSVQGDRDHPETSHHYKDSIPIFRGLRLRLASGKRWKENEREEIPARPLTSCSCFIQKRQSKLWSEILRLVASYWTARRIKQR